MKQACRRAKRRWLGSISHDAEAAFQTANSKQVYQLVKKLNGKRGPQSGIGIKDENVQILYETESIKRRWEVYGRNLFKTESQQSFKDNLLYTDSEPEVLLDEI